MVNFVAAYGWAVSESQAKVISPSAVPPLVPPPQLMIISGRSIIRKINDFFPFLSIYPSLFWGIYKNWDKFDPFLHLSELKIRELSQERLGGQNGLEGWRWEMRLRVEIEANVKFVAVVN
jgi:hypothetical protein